MKKPAAIFIYILGILAAFLFFGVNEARASHTAFNKDRLVEDSIFLAQTMSQADVQSFLVSKGSCLKDFTAEEPIDYYNYGGPVAASRVIWKAGNDWGINPQAILVTLQKEQSLITGDPSFCSTRAHKAMGMGCPDSGSCPQPPYYGFSRQVYKGTWQLRFNFERSGGNTAWNGDGDIYYSGFMTPGCWKRRASDAQCIEYDGNYSLDDTNVYMSNKATASLYRYTPHTCASPPNCNYWGNYNFVHFMNLWFPQPQLIQTDGDTRIFVIDSGKKRLIPNPEVMRAWGYDSLSIKPVSAQERDSIPEIQHLTRFARSTDNPSVYLVDDKTRYGVPSPTIMDSLNKWQEVISVQKEFFNYTTEGPAMNVFIRSKDSNDGGKIYFVDGGIKRYVPEAKHLESLGYPVRTLTDLSAEGIATFANGADMTSVVSEGSSEWTIREGAMRSRLTPLIRDSWNIREAGTAVSAPTLRLYQAVPISHFIRADGEFGIYLLDAGTKRWVPDPDTFFAYGAPFHIQVSQALKNRFPDGPNAGRFLKDPQSAYYFVDSGKRKTLDPQNTALFGVPELPITSAEIINSLGDGGAITKFVKGANPTIYMLDSGKARGIPDLVTFFAWGGSWPKVSLLSEPGVKSFAAGEPLARAASYSSGPLIQGDGPEIFLITDTGKKHIPSASFVWSWGYQRFGLTKASQELLNSFATESGAVDIFGKTSTDPTIYIIDEDRRIALSETYKSNWGLTDSKLSTVKTDYLNLYSHRGTASRVIKAFNSDAIYLLENGQKRWISSPQAYVSSGLSSEPVTLVSQHILGILPDGEPVK